jgi:hypothetical protein
MKNPFGSTTPSNAKQVKLTLKVKQVKLTSKVKQVKLNPKPNGQIGDLQVHFIKKNILLI